MSPVMRCAQRLMYNLAIAIVQVMLLSVNCLLFVQLLDFLLDCSNDYLIAYSVVRPIA
jgi:hypothetical protein